MPSQHAFEPTCERAAQLEELLYFAVPQLVKFVNDAEEEKLTHVRCDDPVAGTDVQASLVDPLSASRESLEQFLKHEGLLSIKQEASSAPALQRVVETILRFSVNPSAAGFLDKLYAGPLPPGWRCL